MPGDLPEYGLLAFPDPKGPGGGGAVGFRRGFWQRSGFRRPPSPSPFFSHTPPRKRREGDVCIAAFLAGDLWVWVFSLGARLGAVFHNKERSAAAIAPPPLAGLAPIARLLVRHGLSFF
ncbi:hypothetical protein LSM04_008952 [Trypanosoma melophagium]|uniref:uncharacterized protein n=1 Tax=Trypanosoma melophagium TaxID=715481 RepID=UPI00351A38D7|nr:hypothetical protein LSM04_008952 [Trypanosoma melophagium]